MFGVSALSIGAVLQQNVQPILPITVHSIVKGASHSTQLFLLVRVCDPEVTKGILGKDLVQRSMVF
jgi:hypothetical protein